MMYAVGSPILYGRMGVCRVESIGVPPFQQDKERDYYKLRAVFSASGELIYIPVDAAASMRSLISKKEAKDCIKQLTQLTPAICSARRPAEIAEHYQSLLASCEIRDSLLLLKEVYLKQKGLHVHGKKLGQVDSQYQRITERLVCEEMAVVLDTTPDEIRSCLYEAMERQEAS